MEPITFWTAAAVIVAICGGIISLVRNSDKDADIADKEKIIGNVKSVEGDLATLKNDVQTKAHRDDIRRVEDRMDKEFTNVRADFRAGIADIKQDNGRSTAELKADNARLAADSKVEMKDMKQELMAAINNNQSK